MKKVILLGFFAICLSFSACKNPKTTKKYQLNITLTERHPHCGGVAIPSDKDKAPTPSKNATYILKKGSQNKEDLDQLQELKTDENGQISLQLPKGQYCLIKAYKNQSFEGFYEQFKTPHDRFFKVKDKACFENWYQQCDLSFEVDQDTSISHTFNFHCFIGDHPCMEYKGPVPP